MCTVAKDCCGYEDSHCDDINNGGPGCFKRKAETTESATPSGQAEFDLLCCPCCGGKDVGEKGPYYTRHEMRQYAYGCHTCGVVALTMASLEEARKRFARRAT